MGIWSRFKDIISSADVFSTTEFLRYQQEPQFQTVFGGTFSIILIAVLIGAFFTKVVATLTMQSISSISSTQNADDPVPLTLTSKGEDRRGFMFGVQIWHHDLNNDTRYFDISLVNRNYKYGDYTNESIFYLLEPCTIDHWKGYPQVQAKYEDLEIHYWLCLPKDTDYIIQGKYSSPIQNALQIEVNKCSNATLDPRPCASDQQISAFFESQTHKVYFTIFFTNPLLNPDSQEYIKYYLQDENYIIFSETGGEQAQILMEDFDITTDNSISPLSVYNEDKGGIVSRSAIKNRFEVKGNNENYCTIFIYKSPDSIIMTREYNKLDNILSYVGGLFGTLTIFLFFIRVFNNHTFEINVGSILYKYDQEKEKLHKYNFIFFIFQQIYGLFKKRFNQSSLWQRVKGYYQCRSELLKQLDILYLLKRVSFLERAISIVLEDHQIKGLHLLQKQTLLEAKKYRKKFKLHEKAIEQCEIFQVKRKNTQTTGKEQSSKVKLKGNRVGNEDSLNFTVQELEMKRPDNQSCSQNQAQRKIQPHLPPPSDNHSNTQSSSSEQGPYQDENTVDLLLRLRKEKEVSTVSKRIYENLNETLKEFIDKYQDKEQAQFDSPIQDDNYSSLLMRNIKTIDFKPKKRFNSLPKMKQTNFARLLKHEKEDNIESIYQSKQQFQQISFK